MNNVTIRPEHSFICIENFIVRLLVFRLKKYTMYNIFKYPYKKKKKIKLYSFLAIYLFHYMM